MDGSAVASVWVWRDRLIFTAASYAAAASSRPATSLLIGTRGEVHATSDRETVSGSALLIGPHVARAVRAENAGLYGLTLDPTHAICRYLRSQVLGGRRIIDLSSRLSPALIELTRSSVTSHHGCASAYRASQQILNGLFPDALGIQPIDPRIDLATSWLWTHVPARVDLRGLAKLCGLSSSRLSHLFTTELGTSLRQYLLWVKVRKTLDGFAKHLSLAEIAHEIGFSDSAHLSRTCKRYAGLTPSFFRDRSRVRIHACDGRVDG